MASASQEGQEFTLTCQELNIGKRLEMGAPIGAGRRGTTQWCHACCPLFLPSLSLDACIANKFEAPTRDPRHTAVLAIRAAAPLCSFCAARSIALR